MASSARPRSSWQSSIFIRCSNAHIANPRHAVAVEDDMAMKTTGDKIPISQRRKKTFFSCMTKYLGSKG